MSKRKKSIDEFFSNYEAALNRGITAGSDKSGEIRGAFADCFVESTSRGVNCGKNDQDWENKVQLALDLYKDIGSKGMNIVSKDISLLDDQHALVKIYWHYDYEKEVQKGTIDFHIVYLLTSATGNLKIVTFITGDEEKALTEKGLIPEPEVAQV